MAMKIRLVCVYCLDSVESIPDGETPTSATCRTCGSPIAYSGPMYHFDATAEIYPDPESLTLAEPQTPAPYERRRNARIGRFMIRERIGGGGYGDVYNAFDPRLEREVALKVLKPGKLDAKATERFLREARAAARLSHNNIVVVHDAGEDDGRFWIAYQLVEGLSLSKIRDTQALELQTAVAIVRDLSDALRHAHARGIYHRDIKPANVIVDEEGVPYLTDFGLARWVDVDSELTGEGTVLGTPAYMSPEQAAGRARDADGRSDIYSLGVILYQLICGCRPRNSPVRPPSRRAQQESPYLNSHSLVGSIPRALHRICMKALALNPEDRYQDAGAFTNALEGWLVPKHLMRGGNRLSTRLLGAVPTVAVAFAVLVASGIGMSNSDSKPRSVIIAQSATDKAALPTKSQANKSISRPVDEPKEGWLFLAGKQSKSRIVHWDHDCPYAKVFEHENRVIFSSLGEAERQQHHSYCPLCRGSVPAPRSRP